MNKRRLFYAGSFLLILIVAGGLVYHFNSSTTNVSKKTQASENAPNNARKDSSTPQDTLNTESSSTNTSNSSTAQASKPAYSVEIVNHIINGQNLHIGDVVNGASTGDCVLTATKSGQTLQLATSVVRLDVNNYDCGIYNIPLSKFTSSGTWTITLTVTNNNGSASGNAIINI